MAAETITVIMGGGRGARLQPLTGVRAKPAVPLAGKYRLIDIPVSNAINSGLREIFVLTQFRSVSLNSHLTATYRFDHFAGGFVEILAAEQTEHSETWYQGTADAVRKQLREIGRLGVKNVLILSGDHLYRMDYRELIARHEETNADVTISGIPLTREGCNGFGVIACDEHGRITGFREKPKANEDISALQVPNALREAWGMGDRPYIASMGIYVFKLSALKELLSDPSQLDFGGEILPQAVDKRPLYVHLFDDYWQDIGTIKSFYEANLALCGKDTPFRFYEPAAPIYTRPRFLPPSVFDDTHVVRSLVADGCILEGARIKNSIVGLRSRICRGVTIEDSIVMGADWLASPSPQEEILAAGDLPMGIGQGSTISRAILDKNVRIGPNCTIVGHPDRPDEEHEHWSVRDGIVIVGKSAVIPGGSVL